jgi:hypothetical protein
MIANFLTLALANELTSEPENLAYAAGIIDGEGHIGIRKDSEKYFTDVVEVFNSNPNIILFFHKNFGGIIKKSYKFRISKKPYYTWILSGLKTSLFLKNIYPFLMAKKNQADILFKFRDTFYEKYDTYNKNSIPKHIIEIRNKLYKELKQLHKTSYDIDINI